MYVPVLTAGFYIHKVMVGATIFCGYVENNKNIFILV